MRKCYICYEAYRFIVELTTYCTKCGKKITKWFETWYAQGNCSCLSVENKTIGTRDEVH